MSFLGVKALVKKMLLPAYGLVRTIHHQVTKAYQLGFSLSWGQIFAQSLSFPLKAGSFSVLYSFQARHVRSSSGHIFSMKSSWAHLPILVWIVPFSHFPHASLQRTLGFGHLCLLREITVHSPTKWQGGYMAYGRHSVTISDLLTL